MSVPTSKPNSVNVSVPPHDFHYCFGDMLMNLKSGCKTDLEAELKFNVSKLSYLAHCSLGEDCAENCAGSTYESAQKAFLKRPIDSTNDCLTADVYRKSTAFFPMHKRLVSVRPTRRHATV